MHKNKSLQLREMVKDDIAAFANYWVASSVEHMQGMGVDIIKRPTKDQIEKLVNDQLGKPIKNRKAYYLTWLADNKPIGNCNVNQFEFRKQAFMHLHVWETAN
jgi:hypothetical protein